MTQPVSEAVALTNVQSYPADPQVSCDFPVQQTTIQNRGSDTVYFSFDGSNDHGELETGESVNLAVGQGLASRDPRVTVSYGYQRVWLRTLTLATDSSA